MLDDGMRLSGTRVHSITACTFLVALNSGYNWNMYIGSDLSTLGGVHFSTIDQIVPIYRNSFPSTIVHFSKMNNQGQAAGQKEDYVDKGTHGATLQWSNIIN